MVTVNTKKDELNQGPLSLTCLTLISAWISNHVPSKMWNEITQPLKFGKWISDFIPHLIMDEIIYPCCDES